MNLRHVTSCGLLLALAALAGCDQGQTRPGQVAVRVVNAAASFEQLGFQRERPPGQQPAALAFKGADAASYDADTYDFYVYSRSLSATTPGGVWSFEETLRENRDYTIVLTDDGTDVDLTLLEYENPGSSNAQVVALHAGGGLPAMDLYVVTAGAGIAGAAPRGTFGPLGQIAPFTLPAGDYEIWLTAAGNPADVQFTSATVALAAAETATLVVTPEAGQGTAALSVAVVRANPGVLYDRNATSELRVINGAADGQPRDFVLDGQFTSPLLPAIPYAAPSSYVEIPVTINQPINVTPAGNPGVIELDQVLSPVAGARQTLIFAGPAGTLTHTVALDEGRRIANEAKIRFFNAANQFGTVVEYVLTPPDEDPALYSANALLTAPGFSPYQPINPGDYDLYVRQNGTNTIVFGPRRISLAARGIYGILGINGADTTTADVVLFEDFP